MLDRDPGSRSEELTSPPSEGFAPVNVRDAPLDQANMYSHFDEAGQGD